MNQEQRIIIFLTSLLCGSAIFFILRNSHQEKKKNNLSLKKEEKNKVLLSKEKPQELSPLVFWIIWMFILFVILIIYAVVYQYLKKYSHEKEKKDKEKKHKQKIRENNSQLFGEAKCTNSECVYIYLTDQSKVKENAKFLVEYDTSDGLPIWKTLQKKEDLLKVIQDIAEMMITFFQHLTGQFLYDVYEISQEEKIEDNLLETISQEVFDAIETDYIFLSQMKFQDIKESNMRHIDNEEKEYLQAKEPFVLLKSVLKHKQLTYYEDENNKKHLLFKHFFLLYRLVEEYYSSLEKYIQKQIAKQQEKKNPEKANKYNELWEKIKKSKLDIEAIIKLNN